MEDVACRAGCRSTPWSSPAQRAQPLHQGALPGPQRFPTALGPRQRRETAVNRDTSVTEFTVKTGGDTQDLLLFFWASGPFTEGKSCKVKKEP